MKFVGIGDLHLDGRLKKYLPTDLNTYVLDEVRIIVRQALKNDIRTCVLYGDVCDNPVMSYAAMMGLINLFREFPKVNFLLLKGNHDHATNDSTSLDVLAYMDFDNAKFALHKPRTFYRNSDHPIVLHPWPLHDVVRGAMNVLHIETKGSIMDSGRVSGSTIELDPEAAWVAGHLHTNHSNFAGTIYQTGFGEKADKFYHIVDLEKSKVRSIPHSPKYRLENIVISKREDLDELIPKDTNTLVKLFIKSKVIITEGALDKFPNVVKHNSFKTKQELEALIMEDFVIDDISAATNFDVDQALSDWMVSENIGNKLHKRVMRLNKQIMTKQESHEQKIQKTKDEQES